MQFYYHGKCVCCNWFVTFCVEVVIIGEKQKTEQMCYVWHLCLAYTSYAIWSLHYITTYDCANPVLDMFKYSLWVFMLSECGDTDLTLTPTPIPTLESLITPVDRQPVHGLLPDAVGESLWSLALVPLLILHTWATWWISPDDMFDLAINSFDKVLKTSKSIGSHFCIIIVM